MNKQETKEYQRKYYQANKEKISKRHRVWRKIWRKANPEMVSASNHRYYIRHREELKRKRRERYAKEKKK